VILLKTFHAVTALNKLAGIARLRVAVQAAH